MNVALFSTTVDPTNGYGNITLEYCKALQNAGVMFTLFLPTSESQRVQAMHLPYAIDCVLPRPVFRIFERHGFGYFRTIDVTRFDLVHSLFAFPYCIIASRSAKRWHKPFMMGAQGTYGVLPLTRYPERWLLKACYAHARHIVVPSAFTRDAILRQAKESYAIDIVHNGVDFERFQKIIDGTRLRTLHGSGPFLLTVGGLKPRKGQDLVIRALPSIIAAHPNVHYLLVGEGSMRSELQNLASSLGVSHHITFVGSKTGDDLVTYFHLADIYVHTPKVVHWNFEGFGIVYLEAGACGVPSVATDAGGVRDAIVDQKTGIIVPDGDCAAIAQAVTSLLSDPQKRATMGADAKKYAAEHDWRYIVERFLPFYRDCV